MALTLSASRRPVTRTAGGLLGWRQTGLLEVAAWPAQETLEDDAILVREGREQAPLVLQMAGRDLVDQPAPARRQSHEPPAPVAGVGAALDQPGSLEAMQAVRHCA